MTDRDEYGLTEENKLAWRTAHVLQRKDLASRGEIFLADALVHVVANAMEAHWHSWHDANCGGWSCKDVQHQLGITGWLAAARRHLEGEP